MFKIELFFDESLGEAELKKLGAKIDKIFADKGIVKPEKTLLSRIFLDCGRKSDFGRMIAALGEIKSSRSIVSSICAGYFYYDDEKEDLIVEFFGR